MSNYFKPREGKKQLSEKSYFQSTLTDRAGRIKVYPNLRPSESKQSIYHNIIPGKERWDWKVFRGEGWGK